jgi:hypothetical protein
MNTSYTCSLLRGMLPHGAALLWENIGHSRNVLRPPGPHSIHNAYIRTMCVQRKSFVKSVHLCFVALRNFSGYYKTKAHKAGIKGFWAVVITGEAGSDDKASAFSSEVLSFHSPPRHTLSWLRFYWFSSVSSSGCRDNALNRVTTEPLLIQHLLVIISVYLVLSKHWRLR